MIESLKRVVRRTPVLEYVAYLVHNTLFPFMNFSGTSLRGRSVAEAVEYVRLVANRYRNAAQNINHSFAGATVLEIGPGDNLGVALCLVAWGAERVVCLDRFDCLGQHHREREIYRALLNGLPPGERARAQRNCPWVEQHAPHDLVGAIHYLPGTELERCAPALAPYRFDCVVSNAALEHMSNVKGGFAELLPSLKSEAWMFHEVDLRCHSRFAAVSPLHFLTVPEPVWHWMGSRLGAPNRLRINGYRKIFAEAGFTIREEVLESVPMGVANATFPRIDRRINAQTPADLVPLVVRLTLLRNAASPP
jgi:hypothetical protein